MAFQMVLNRYLPSLQDCRDLIVTDLKKTPDTAILAEYLQGGKMFRALLAFMAADAIGIELATMVSIASALELLHGASLIHDDIVDNAKERRGHLALHVQVGIGPALILGDYLMLRSFTVLRQSGDIFGLQRVAEASNTLNAYAQACCLGELRGLTAASAGDREDEYVRIAEGKTASQFAASVTVPAILGGGTQEEIEALRTYGLNLGIAFQIHDDVLDVDEDTETLQQSDARARLHQRLGLPVLYLERYGSPTAMQQYRQIMETKNGRQGQLGVLLREEGILDRIHKTQAKYVSVALQALDSLGASEARTHLGLLASYAVDHRAHISKSLDCNA